MDQPNPPPADLRAQSLRGGAWAAAGEAGASVVALASFLVLSRILGPEAYGIVAMADAALAFSLKLMSSGLSEPLIQMPDLRDEHSDTLFWVLQGVALSMIALTAALSGAIGAFFKEASLPLLLCVASSTLYLQAIGLVPGALLARRFAFRETAKASFISQLAGGVAGIVAALYGAGVWALVLQRVTTSGTQSALLLVQSGWRPRLRFSAAALRDSWRFSASRGLEGMLLFCDQQIPRIVLGHVSGATELGHFVFARRIVENTVQLFNGPIRAAALSTFAATQTDLERVRRIYAEGTALTASTIVPACAGIALVAPYLVPLFAGPEWQPSILLLQLLVIASIRHSFHLWNAALLRGLGKPERLLFATAARTLTTQLLLPIGLSWGAPGICVAVLCGSYLSWPIAMYFVREASRMSLLDQLRPMRGPLVSTIFMTASVLLLQMAVGTRLGLVPVLAFSVVAGVAAYAAAMSLVGRRELMSLWRNARVLHGGRGTAGSVR